MSDRRALSRRDFIAGSAAAGAVLASPRLFANTQSSDSIKVGLIGCGGRGTGAAVDAFRSTKGVSVIAMGDLFEDRLTSSRNNLKAVLKDSYKVTDDSAHVGWDAYKKVIASDADYVIIGTPPAFRPQILAEAINAGKHVFMEKPVAVDAPGIRSILESSHKADMKGLSIVAGTQRRHDRGYRAVIERIHDGQIGDIRSMRTWWNGGELWHKARKPEWSDVEYQVRNWLYYTYLSGDHITEQHVHQLDIANWVMQGHPIKAYGMGGRQKRTDPAYGHIYDHFAIQYTFENEMVHHSMCRQMDGTASRVSEHVTGSKGTSNCSTNIYGDDVWKFVGKRENPYVLEHRDLINAIRSGNQVNEGVNVAHATMAAIMGRMAAYTGKEITWDMAINSEEELFPSNLQFGDRAVAEVAIPGITQFV
jgi:predicted dehydrogenase